MPEETTVRKDRAIHRTPHGPAGWDLGVGLQQAIPATGSAVYLNPSGRVFHHLTVQADFGNPSTSYVYVGSEGTQNIALPPGGIYTFIDVSPNKIFVKGSTTGLTLHGAGYGNHLENEVWEN